MDFNKIIETINIENNPRKTYVYLETIILKLLERELEKQNKILLTNYRVKDSDNKYVYEYDAVAPDGFDNFEGSVVFEIKFFTKKESFYYLLHNNRLIEKLLYTDNKLNTIIFIFPTLIDEEDKKIFINRFPLNSKKIVFWDINAINKLIENNKEYYNEISNNIYELALNNSIRNTLKAHKQDWKEIRNTYIHELSDSFKKDDLVLLLGAGVSADAGIPSWDKLVSELLVSLIEVKLEENNISFGKDERDLLVSALKNENANSPLLQTRYIRTGLKTKFNSILNSVLYKKCATTSELLKAIAKLCQPQRNINGVKAIVTYNFDDLIEKNLNLLEISNKSIFRDSDIASNESLSIYHVHGYLPEEAYNSSDIEDSLLVFSEEGYHKVMLDPYHWSNLVQLNFLRENTCLLIGLSVTDPNLRRLLDIATRKRHNDESRHYVILKREDISLKTKSPNSKENISISKFNSVNYSLQEEVLKELGLKVIWAEEYNEIPNILKKIKQKNV